MRMNENNKIENTKLVKPQKYLIAFVDTENVSPNGDSGLISLIDYKYKDYERTGIWCYGIDDSKSGSTVAWKKICDSASGYFIWKEVKGPRKKNKVDDAIKGDIDMLLHNPKNEPIVLWVIATADGDYGSAVRHIKKKGHKVVVAHSGALSDKLIRLCDDHFRL